MIRVKKKKRGRPFYLTSRDQRILHYIWRWKLASTASVHEAVGRPDSPYTTYKVLDKLERNRFLDCHYDHYNQFYVWQLSELGFSSLKLALGDLIEDGYLSENHRHDRLVQAFQLGEWSSLPLPVVDFFTEQDLRRREMDSYPDWLPRSKEHRPDGYSRIKGSTQAWTLAYEVELSPKSVQRYEAILRFYKHARVVDRVLWLVETDQVRDLIVRAKTCIKDDSKDFHVFVGLNEFLRAGWDAPVTNECSNTLFTLREKYREICGDFYGDLMGNTQGHSKVSVHLQSAKVIGKTRR